MTDLARNKCEPRRNLRKRTARRASARKISLVILIAALLRALVELATAVLSLLE
jgi:hypothetical protein